MTNEEEIAALVRRCEWEAFMSGVAKDDPKFMKKIYFDQQPESSLYDSGLYIYSCLGESGVKEMDQEYAQSIMSIDSLPKGIILARKILEERRLHAWIRFNLLDNLTGYLKINWRKL